MSSEADPVSILDFYLPADAGDYALAMKRALVAGAQHISWPSAGIDYRLDTECMHQLTKDLYINYNGQKIGGAGRIKLEAPGVMLGTLAAPASAGTTQLHLSDAGSLAPDDIINLQANLTVATSYTSENKNETVRVLRVSGSTVFLARPLRFAWSASDAGLGLTAWRGLSVTTRGMNYASPQVQGGTSTVMHLYLMGFARVFHDRPRLTGLDDGFNTEANIYRAGVVHYYCDTAEITGGCYERMSYPMGFYACGVIHETATGFQNHHTSADLGNWSHAYFGRVDDSGSFTAWSSHMCHWYQVQGRVENNTYAPSVRAVGSRRSGYYFTNDTTDFTVENDPGMLEPDFAYLWDGENVKQQWHDFELRTPNRQAPAVQLNGGRVSLRGFQTDRRDIVARSGVSLLEIGEGCSFGGGVAPQTWNSLDLGTQNVRLTMPDVRDAYLSNGIYHIDPRRQAVPQSERTLQCRGSVFRKDGGGTARAVRVHLNAFFGLDVQFLVGKLTLITTLQHQSLGHFSAVEQDYGFFAYPGGTGVLVMSDVPSKCERRTGPGGVKVSQTLSNISLINLGIGTDNCIQFDVVPSSDGSPLLPDYAVDYVLDLKETTQ